MNQVVINTIKGSVNVITGCGSGLGRETLSRFLKNGCGPVLGIDRHFASDYEDDLKLSEEQRSKLTLRTHDTFDERVEDSLAEFAGHHGTIDNVINVAGVALAFALTNKKETVPEINSVNAKHLFEFNTVGTFNMIRLASKYMIDSTSTDSDSSKDHAPRKTKCIINTSCISTTSPVIGQNAYAGSKASLDSMTLCIARDLSRFRIRCNTINVGFFDTKLLRCSEDRVTTFLEKSVSLCPRKIGQPEQFAYLVQAIVENQMVNGCCIKIDAGSRPDF